MANKFSNRLINESSPYLLQHAHNPVDWYPWGEEALAKAVKENKIILISIGYSACHWCHVMERESFENEKVAALMNEHFINIKIDREERPDLDHIYMDAVQTIAGNGGWPLNVFLTPEAKPFFGGTYFPPSRAYNRSSWTEVLQQLAKAWKTKEEEIRIQADQLTDHLTRANEFGLINKSSDTEPTPEFFIKEDVDLIFRQIMKSADTTKGGFGGAPKFPQTFILRFLLQYHYFSGNSQALEQALLSVDKMLEGGIYDQIGGGLARYSTDEEWLAPHFEKMLYDNALFLVLLCDAYQVTQNKYYEKAIRKTIAFVERELMRPEGGFYAALDADSEGEEGKFYVWDKKEIDDLLGQDARLFCEFFNITESGNWSHEAGAVKKNILRIFKKMEIFAFEKQMNPGEVEITIDHCIEKVFQERKKRVRPQLDNKILLNWNALMVTALTRAAAVLDDAHYRKLAEDTYEFLIQNFTTSITGISLQHIYGNNSAKNPAFLDDYAYLIQCSIELQELSSTSRYLDLARRLTLQVTEDFMDPDTGFFFFTRKNQEDVIVRKKEMYDGAVPSGNSIMAENLFYLAVIFNRPDWQVIAQRNTGSLKKAMIGYPGSFCCWASVAMKQVYGINEIVITGPEYQRICKELLKYYLPDKILQGSDQPDDNFHLFAGKIRGSETLIYLCKQYSCKTPVKTLKELFFQMGKEEPDRLK